MRTTASLAQIVDQWLMETDVLPATAADYRRKIGLWFRWLSSEDIDPRTPRRQHILLYKQSLQKENRSKLTVGSYVTVVRLFYKFCDRARIYEDIGAGIKSSFKYTEHRKEALTSAEAARLLSSIDTDTIVGRRDKLMIALMLTNGLRCCEVERIDIQDFNTQRGRTILHIRRKGRTDKQEIVAVPPLIMELVRDYTSCRDITPSGPLFLNHSSNSSAGDRLGKISIGIIVKQRLRAIGIDRPQITAHSLRHTCGSLLVENGVEVEQIRDLLGHSDTATTRIYIEMAQRQKLLSDSPANLIADIISKPMKKSLKR